MSETTTTLNGLARIQQAREGAARRFAELGFPTPRDEDWKYTNMAAVAKTRFQPGPFSAEGVAERIEDAGFANCRRLVFVNGHFSRELSFVGDLPKGVRTGNIAANLENEHLARYAAYEDHAFVAQNTANFEDGAFLNIPNGTVLEDPIYFLYVSTGSGEVESASGDLMGPQATVSYPRNLIVSGRDSQAAIVEAYLSLNGSVYFTNTVTELVAGEGAVVDHYKLGLDGPDAYHFGLLRTQQGRSSNVSTFAITFGGALVRNELNVVLDGEGAEATLNGLYVLNGSQHVDNHTTIDHAQPRCNSHELYKGVLDGRSEGVFHGRIIVRPQAQKTDAIQRNRNLLLSEGAIINTKPQLEIYADDVKCTHGATVGQVDPEAVFYLRSRGIDGEDARRLLTNAFAGEIIEKVKVEAIRSRLGSMLFEALGRRRD